MKRMLLGIAAVVLIGAAVASSGSKSIRPELDFQREKLNPVSHLRLNNDPADFQFVIVSDRTGGHRAEVFSQAVEQINLLQPEFVVCVGDLIEGYTADRQMMAREWREFQGYVSRLQMPFFYLPGNHDLANRHDGRGVEREVRPKLITTSSIATYTSSCSIPKTRRAKNTAPSPMTSSPGWRRR